LEVGKTLRAHGTHGPSYGETSSRAATFVPSAKDERPQQHAFTHEEAVSTVPASIDREHSVLRAWIAAEPSTKQLIQETRSIARTSSAVLIRGENGTGKSLLAWILHALGPRANHPFIHVDCASIPQELLETELFGDELNSGAASGRLKSAAGGTIVLDNVEALTIPAQAKLLRLMEDRRFDSIGNGRTGGSLLDARIVALTSSNLEEAVGRRTFREDLYYRLNVIPIVVPALRERPQDIRALTAAFLRQIATGNRLPRLALDAAAMAALESYSFPGNVRELRCLLERTAHSAGGSDMQLKDLPPQVRESFSGAARNKISLEDLERSYISEVLDHTRGKKTMAAKILGISRKTLLEKRKRYGLN
jgi:DNA-binding NtrC family response regulator